MTDELRRVYEHAGALDRYFEGQTPVPLYRGRRAGDTTDLMQPVIIGWNTQRGPRPPDVLVLDERNTSPQYTTGDTPAIVTDGKTKALTADIIKHADKYVVKGCRTMRGDHRGVSVFDKKNTRLGNFHWYKIPAGTKLPEAIAITRDSSRKEAQEPIHHTVAPKDDMPLSLFLQYLKVIASSTTKD
jgi:hypothetical protein